MAFKVHTVNDFFIKPTYFVSAALGLTFDEVETHLFSFLYRLFILFLLVMCLVTDLPSILFWTDTSRNFSSYLQIFKIGHAWFTVFSTFLVTAFNSNAITKIMREVLKLDLIFEEFATRKYFRFQVLHLLLNVSIIISFQSLGVYLAPSNLQKFYLPLMYSFTEFQTQFVMLQFVNSVLLIREYLKVLNVNLIHIQGQMKGRHPKMISSTVSELRRLRCLHFKLCALSKRLNSRYSFQLLAYTTKVFIEITFAVSSFLNINQTTLVLGIVLSLTVMGFYISTILQMCASCELAVMECEKTGIIVHSLSNFSNGEVLLELRTFSIQMLHQQIKFTAADFFPIGMELVLNITSGVSTFFLIIVTFASIPKNGAVV